MSSSQEDAFNPYSASLATEPEAGQTEGSDPQPPQSIVGALRAGAIRGFWFGGRVAGVIVGTIAVAGVVMKLLVPNLFPRQDRIDSIPGLLNVVRGAVGGTLVCAMWGALCGAIVMGVSAALGYRRSGHS
jgi:hypothetical protein